MTWVWVLFSALMFFLVVIHGDKPIVEWLKVVVIPSVLMALARTTMRASPTWVKTTAEFDLRQNDFDCILGQETAPTTEEHDNHIQRKGYRMRYQDIEKMTWTIQDEANILDVYGQMIEILWLWQETENAERPCFSERSDGVFRLVLEPGDGKYIIPDVITSLGMSMEQVEILDIRRKMR